MVLFHLPRFMDSHPVTLAELLVVGALWLLLEGYLHVSMKHLPKWFDRNTCRRIDRAAFLAYTPGLPLAVAAIKLLTLYC